MKIDREEEQEQEKKEKKLEIQNTYRSVQIEGKNVLETSECVHKTPHHLPKFRSRN